MSTTRQYPVMALAPSASLAEALTAHWRFYLMEGVELGALMLSTCCSGTLLYSADSPLSHLDLSRPLKSMLMGVAIAATTFLIIRSPFGRRSGAHFNPAITLTYFWLGRVHRWDAVSYVMAHFFGGATGVLAAREILGMSLSAAPVSYVVTVPGSHGIPVAFVGEFLLSGLLMGIVLYASNHRLVVHFTPLLVASLTVFYYTLSTSISGFSVNPARSFSSALFAWVWYGIWIYFLAPSIGMLTSAAIYSRAAGADRVYCAKVFHDLQSPCPFRCAFERVYQQT
jgi:aquaporin Z